MSNDITIDRRFRGPATSGNGGYSCGLLAQQIEGTAEVTLRAPPPLDRPLQLEVDETGARLFDGDALVATARPSTLELDVPDPPSLSASEAATAHYAGRHDHILPECFVCGPTREPGDGLRLFTGPVPDRNVVACPWMPEASLGDGTGSVRPEFVWAALDCPSYFGLQTPGLFALLGRMTCTIHALPRVGQTLRVTGWRIGAEGRKHYAGAALYDEGGEVLGRAHATWIALDPKQRAAAGA